MEAKIISPSKPSECAAAVSMSEDDAEHPYASVFYTSHEGRIRFFGLAVTGTKTVEEGNLLTYGEGNTDPDKATCSRGRWKSSRPRISRPWPTSHTTIMRWMPEKTAAN